MRQRNLQLALAFVGVAGIVALFVPFIGNVSPLDAILDETYWDIALWKLALPFFLAIPVLVASIRLAMTHSLSKLESTIGYILGGTTVGIWMSWFFVSVSNDPGTNSGPTAWLGLALLIGPYLLGIALLVLDLRKNRLLAYRPIFVLQVAYLGNITYCFVVASDFSWQIGAWLSLITTIAYLVQIGLPYSQPRQLPAST